MKLISELTEEVSYITEAKDENGSKNYFIEGVIMQGNIKNRNGRVYPTEVLGKEVKRYNETYVAKKRAYGELGHPQGPTINLDRVSHLFTELKEDGNNIVGKAKIMDTPMGKIVKNLIDEGAQLGISSRGMGSIKANKQGIMEVQHDFILATAGDIVADPSAPDAYVRGIMENTEWYFDVASQSWTALEVIEEHIEEVKSNYRQIDEAKTLNMFKQFINSLSKS